MAKNKENSKLGIAELNAQNLDESLKNANKMDEEILNMATEKMEKEEKERLADELMRKLKKANYQNFRIHIDFKYLDEAAEAEKEMLKLQKAELDKFTKGEITPVEYEDALTKIGSDGNNKIDKLADVRRNRIRELQKKYGEWYSLSWDDPFIRANAKIRSALS